MSDFIVIPRKRAERALALLTALLGDQPKAEPKAPKPRKARKPKLVQTTIESLLK